jgi:DedD protein
VEVKPKPVQQPKPVEVKPVVKPEPKPEPKTGAYAGTEA